jgi:hypothetical protein
MQCRCTSNRTITHSPSGNLLGPLTQPDTNYCSRDQLGGVDFLYTAGRGVLVWCCRAGWYGTLMVRFGWVGGVWPKLSPPHSPPATQSIVPIVSVKAASVTRHTTWEPHSPVRSPIEHSDCNGGGPEGGRPQEAEADRTLMEGREEEGAGRMRRRHYALRVRLYAVLSLHLKVHQDCSIIIHPIYITVAP